MQRRCGDMSEKLELGKVDRAAGLRQDDKVVRAEACEDFSMAIMGMLGCCGCLSHFSDFMAMRDIVCSYLPRYPR